MRVAGILSLGLLALLLPTIGVDARGVNDKSASKDKVGIREVIPADARGRYEKWKEQVLSTDFGRQQWDFYATSKDFLLTIVVSDDRKFGAGTGDFEWDEHGKLVAATITLGKHLDKGLPDPVYYPVMNSLATYNSFYEIDGSILASTKIIHEIAHVNTTEQADAKLFQKQDKLIASYNSIFLKNGYDTNDPRLVALADELGAKPIEIWEDREYQSEMSAMRFLMQRIGRESFYCSVMDRMKRNIMYYARSYEARFLQVSSQQPCNN